MQQAGTLMITIAYFEEKIFSTWPQINHKEIVDFFS